MSEGPKHQDVPAIGQNLPGYPGHPDRRMLEATRTALLHVMNGGNGSYDHLHGRLRSVWDMLDGYLEGAPGRESQP